MHGHTALVRNIVDDIGRAVERVREREVQFSLPLEVGYDRSPKWFAGRAKRSSGSLGFDLPVSHRNLPSHASVDVRVRRRAVIVILTFEDVTVEFIKCPHFTTVWLDSSVDFVAIEGVRNWFSLAHLLR